MERSVVRVLTGICVHPPPLGLEINFNPHVICVIYYVPRLEPHSPCTDSWTHQKAIQKRFQNDFRIWNFVESNHAFCLYSVGKSVHLNFEAWLIKDSKSVCIGLAGPVRPAEVRETLAKNEEFASYWDRSEIALESLLDVLNYLYNVKSETEAKSKSTSKQN